MRRMRRIMIMRRLLADKPRPKAHSAAYSLPQPKGAPRDVAERQSLCEPSRNVTLLQGWGPQHLGHLTDLKLGQTAGGGAGVGRCHGCDRRRHMGRSAHRGWRGVDRWCWCWGRDGCGCCGTGRRVRPCSAGCLLLLAGQTACGHEGLCEGSGDGDRQRICSAAVGRLSTGIHNKVWVCTTDASIRLNWVNQGRCCNTHKTSKNSPPFFLGLECAADFECWTTNPFHCVE